MIGLFIAGTLLFCVYIRVDSKSSCQTMFVLILEQWLDLVLDITLVVICDVFEQFFNWNLAIKKCIPADGCWFSEGVIVVNIQKINSYSIRSPSAQRKNMISEARIQKSTSSILPRNSSAIVL